MILLSAAFAETESSITVHEYTSKDEIYCGVGGSIGVQKTKVSINRGFPRSNHAVHSVFYGGTFAVGYSQQVCGNCSVGIEGGIDLGSARSSTFGGILEYESSYVQREVKLRDALRQMLSEAGRSLDTQLSDYTGYNNVISNNVWRNFANVLRYIGGRGDVNVSGNFVADPATGGGVFNNDTYVANANARLGDFIPNSLEVVRQLGDGDILVGMQQIRSFIGRRYPNYAAALANIATNNLLNSGGVAAAGTSIAGDSNINAEISDIISEFLLNNMGNDISYRNLGIDATAMGGVTFDQMRAIMDSIYYPSPEDDIALTVPYGVDRGSIVNSVKTKATFGVCPYLACKIGYYYNEIRGTLYAKFGFTMLNGKVSPANNVYGIQAESFHKITPMIAVGMAKQLDDNWGYAVEISHAFKAKKRLRDANFFGVRVENKTSISRTTVRLMATYRF